MTVRVMFKAHSILILGGEDISQNRGKLAKLENTGHFGYLANWPIFSPLVPTNRSEVRLLLLWVFSSPRVCMRYGPGSKVLRTNAFRKPRPCILFSCSRPGYHFGFPIVCRQCRGFKIQGLPTEHQKASSFNSLQLNNGSIYPKKFCF